MFKNPPKILAHNSALHAGSFVTPEFILSRNDNRINALSRMCPHRFYPIGVEGENIENITCKFHGFQFDSNGTPLNNNLRLPCTDTTIGRSGLIFRNFNEPHNEWVDTLQKETNLSYYCTFSGTSSGSWLWMMDVQVDLLHIKKNGIHPVLSTLINLDDIKMIDGDGWILQTFETGWWLCIYPYTFVEWTEGCVAINYVIPKDMNHEYGFKWTTQIYFDLSVVTTKQQKDFMLIEDVFKEDVEAIEKQMRPYIPLLTSDSRLENQVVHFGDWVIKNRL